MKLKRHSAGETRAYFQGMRQALRMLRAHEDSSTPLRDAVALVELQVEMAAQSAEAILDDGGEAVKP